MSFDITISLAAMRRIHTSISNFIGLNNGTREDFTNFDGDIAFIQITVSKYRSTGRELGQCSDKFTGGDSVLCHYSSSFTDRAIAPSGLYSQ
jgi:hypothetical protein